MSQALRDDTYELRQRLNDPPALASLLGLDRGMQRISAGRVLVQCPAHADSTASCSILYHQEDQSVSVKCFGCDLSGNVFHLIAAARRLDVQRDFPRVLDEARRLAGMAPRSAPAPREQPRPQLRVVGPTPEERRFAAAAEVLLELTQLTDLAGSGGEVAASLAFRGLLDEARADAWGALPPAPRWGADCGGGYDGEGAERVLCDESSPLLAALDDAGALAGLRWLCASQGWQHPDHRLLIPWRGPGGRLWTLQRRWVRPDGDTAASPPKLGQRTVGKYLFPPTSSLNPSGAWPYGWDRAESGAFEELWLCEGAVDVLALRALNRRGELKAGGGERPLAVLGLAGLQSWGKVRDDVLALAKGRRCFVALDSDEPAEKAADQIGPELYRAGALRVTRIRPRQGKDWAEWLQKLPRRGP
jgi:DNA primase